jgi:hypothetical protein
MTNWSSSHAHKYFVTLQLETNIGQNVHIGPAQHHGRSVGRFKPCSVTLRPDDETLSGA